MIGGIVGASVGKEDVITKILRCKNYGTITGDRDRVGGITGEADEYSLVSECSNYGKVIGKGVYTGGIVGLVAHNKNVTNSTVEKCYNCGDVEGTTDTGGVVGLLGGSQGKGNVTQCYNKGKITGTQVSRTGEVIGRQTNTSGLNTLNKLFYLKNERGLNAVGGKTDDEGEDKIMGITNDFTYEEFKNWIPNQ